MTRNMKTINTILKSVGLSVLLTFTSCSGFLDVTPHDATDDKNSLETISDYDMLMKDPYASMRDVMGSYYILLPDIMSDNLTLCYAGRLSFNEFFNFNFNSTTFGVSAMWSGAYNGIMATNKIINTLEGETNKFTGTADEAQAKNILAEALAMRAFLHFQLVRLYGKDYKAASETDLGVPYKTLADVTLPSRNTVKDVYDNHIVKDLEKAKTLMTAEYNQKDNTRLNRKSLCAIMAKVYLTMGKYQEAANNAAAAIAGDGSDIATIEQFQKLWTSPMTNVSEILLRYPVLSTDDVIPGNNWGQGESKTSYKAEYVASAAFVDLVKNTDVRITTLTGVSSGGKNYVAVWKWNGCPGEAAGNVDITAIRTSEMYLTLAEALTELNDDPNALKTLNYLRSNRYVNFTSPNETGTALKNAIALERRLELSFEGDRFFELKRKGLDIVRDERGDEADGGGVAPSLLHLPANSPYFLLPIPQSEMDANKNMEQNKY